MTTSIFNVDKFCVLMTVSDNTVVAWFVVDQATVVVFTIGFVSVFVYQYVILTKFVTIVIVLFFLCFYLGSSFF